MKLENQVCTLEQAKRLKELGIIGKPTFYHNISIGTINQISMFNENDLSNGGDWYPAYTTSEIGVALPNEVWTTKENGNGYGVGIAAPLCFDCESYGWQNFTAEAHSRADILIWLLQNNLIKSEQVNERLSNS